MARVTWRLLPFLLLLYIISWLDRVNVGFAKLQMNADLGMSDTAYGLGAGIFFFVGYALCEVPSNLLLVRFGARMLDRAHHDHLGTDLRRHDVRARATTSFYVDALPARRRRGRVPARHRLLPEPVVPARAARASAVSWFMIGIPLSIVFGGPLSGWLLGFDGHLGLQGWQWMFLLEGLPAVLLGFVVLGFLTEKPADAHWLTAEQRQWLERAHRGRACRGAGRHQFSVRAGAAASHGLVARRSSCSAARPVVMASRFWVPSIVKGLVGLHRSRGGLFLGVAVHRGGDRHGADRPQLRSQRRTIPARRDSDGDRRAGFRRHGAAACRPIAAMIALTVAAVGDYCTRGPFWALPGKFLSGSAAARRHRAHQRDGRRGRLHRAVHRRLPQGSHRQFPECRCCCWPESSWSAPS